jgi:hypothetical protein
MALRLRRGTNAQRQTITPVEGELLFTTDTQQLYVGAINPGTGLPYPGGVGVSSPVTSVNGKTGPVQLVSSDLSEGTSNFFYSTERAQDAAAALFLGATGEDTGLTVGTDNSVHSNITFTYNDTTGRLSASVGATYTNEDAIDAVAAALVAGTHTGITFTYGSTQDTANRIDATVTAASNSFTNIMVTPGITTVITDVGSGYTSVPAVTVTAPPVGGVQAVITPVMAGTSLAYILPSVAGTGYSQGVTASASAAGSSIALANATVDTGTGAITGFMLTHAGLGFTEAPTVTIVKPTAATATYISGGLTTTIVVGPNSALANTIYVGMAVSGTGFTAGQKVLTVTAGVTNTTITLSAGASTIPSGTLTFTDVGVDAVAIAGIVGTTVLELVVTDEGSVYISVPTVTIAQPTAFTFDGSSQVNVSANTITLANHPFITGAEVTYSNGGGSSVVASGLTSGSTIYIIKVDQNTIRLATSIFNAFRLIPIDITATGSGSAHSFRGIRATATARLSLDVIADAANDTLTLVAGDNINLATSPVGDAVIISAKSMGQVNFGPVGTIPYYNSSGSTLATMGDTLKYIPATPDDPNNGAIAIIGRLEFDNAFPKIYSNVGTLTLGSKISGGFVEVGDRDYSGRFGIVSNTYIANNGAQFKIQQSHDTVDASNMNFIRSRGTVDAPTINLSGDKSGDVIFQAYDGANYITHAAVNAVVDGTFTGNSNRMPGRLDFYTRSATDTVTGLALRLSGDKTATFTSTVTATGFVSSGTGTPSVASATNLDLSAAAAVRVIGGGTFRLPQLTTTARDLLTAANGDLIYNTTDNKIQGYENGAWVNLVA